MAGDVPGEFARAERHRATADVLEALPRADWRVLHDVPWPGRPRVTIDHVVVGRSGVFVVHAKSWAGTVEVRDGLLMQDRYSRQGAVSRAAEAARAVGTHLRNARCPVTPVLCLERDEALAVECDGVLVCTTSTVGGLLRERGPVLDDVQVQRLARDLTDHTLPVVRASSEPTGLRPGRGVVLLFAALVALCAAIFLVGRPDLVADTVKDLALWVAERVD